MKLLFSSPNAPEVGVLKGLLDEAGIACEVRNESTATNLPGAEFQPEIWVLNENDYARAGEIRDACCQSATPEESDDLRERVESARSEARALAVIAVVILTATVFLGWQFARAGHLGALMGVLITFGSLGGLLMWTAITQLRRWAKKSPKIR